MIKSIPKHFFDFTRYHKNYHLHSRYRHTINFIHGDELISIHTVDYYSSPMGIITHLDEEQFKKVFESIQTITFNRDGLIYGNHTVTKDNVQLSEHHLILTMDQYGKLIDHQLHRLIQEIQALLKVYWSQYSNPFHLIFKRKLENLQQALDGSSVLLTAIESLIGFGYGLTPTGDDILCGLLVGLLFSHQWDLFGRVSFVLRELLSGKDRTSIISKQFLKYATEGMFIEPIVNLYQHLSLNQPINHLLNQIYEMGHTSGSDFLYGITIGLKRGGDVIDL